MNTCKLYKSFKTEREKEKRKINETNKQRHEETETAQLLHQKNSDNETVPGSLVLKKK